MELTRNGNQLISSVNKTTPTHSTGSAPPLLPAAMKGASLLPILERLCSAKRTVEFSDHQAETWLASLSVFDTKIVAEAVIRIAHSDDPFPDLGKLVTRCDQLQRERSGEVHRGDGRLGTKTIKQLAKCWGVEI